MAFMLNISHPMTGIMAMDTCSWLRRAEGGGNRRSEWDGGEHGSSLFTSLYFFFCQLALDSSGTERDEMDTWLNESLIKLLSAF